MRPPALSRTTACRVCVPRSSGVRVNWLPVATPPLSGCPSSMRKIWSPGRSAGSVRTMTLSESALVKVWSSVGCAIAQPWYGGGCAGAGGTAGQPDVTLASEECSGLMSPSAAVVQLQLHRVRRHAELRDLLELEARVRVDDVVGEHAAAGEELPIPVQVLERHVERVAHGRNVLRLLGLEIVEILVGRVSGMDR